MPYGTYTPTVANSPLPFTYPGTGATVALGIGFIPTSVQFFGATLSWLWVRGMAFGDAHTFTPSWSLGPVTGGVLDVLDGSGRASTNVGTTSSVIGLLIGTNTAVNSPGSTYFGLCYR